MTFKTHINDLLPKSLDEVKNYFADPANRKKLGELTFFDLLLENPETDTGVIKGMNHGVYLFFNPDGKCAYVGKTCKQGFAERIGSHFGTHKKATGNNYLSRTLNKNYPNSEHRHQDYAAQVKEMGDHSITLINVYDWNSVAETLKDRGVDATHFIKKKEANWGTLEFVTELEKTLQSVYCPPEKISESEDSFLNSPKRRKKMRARKNQINDLAEKRKNFAEIIRETI